MVLRGFEASVSPTSDSTKYSLKTATRKAPSTQKPPMDQKFTRLHQGFGRQVGAQQSRKSFRGRIRSHVRAAGTKNLINANA
jgi:hypothetical protein